MKGGNENKREKAILHMDGDAFFVGVEVAKNPALRGCPVVTGEERGIVSPLSYEAKALGITRGMPIYRVQKEFPQVLILPGDYKSYAKYSSMMFDIVRRYVDDVEEYSIDECFADLTGYESVHKMSYFEIARRIKKEVNDELDLSVSLGVAPTKVLAKVASNWVKPNGLTEIKVGTAPDFLKSVPIGKIWGIGPRTAEALKRKSIQTAGDFAERSINWVMENFSKPYVAIWQELHGQEVVHIDPKPKALYSSIQKTRSFHPFTNDKNFLLSQFSKHIEDACKKARHYDLAPKKAAFFLKTKGFKYFFSKVTLKAPTNSPEVILSLLGEHLGEIHKRGVLYRTTGVVLMDLTRERNLQADLFGGTKQLKKLEHIHESIDRIEEKLGKRVVYLASTHSALTRKEKGTESDDLDRDLLFL